MRHRPNTQLSLNQIQQHLAAFNKTGTRAADAPDNAVYNLIQQLVKDGVAPSDEFKERADEINLIKAHFAQHGKCTSGDLLMYVFQKIQNEASTPAQYIPLIKVFLRGNGNLLTRILQLLNQFLDKDKQVEEKIPEKIVAKRVEEIKMVFIAYVYTHGDEEDKKFLSQQCYGQLYYQMLCEVTASGEQWICDALKQAICLPNELANLYDIWRLSNELRANAKEIAKYKIIARLAHLHAQQNTNGNQSLLLSIPSNMFATQDSLANSFSVSQFYMMSVPQRQNSVSLLGQSRDFVLIDEPTLPTSFQSIVDKIAAIAKTTSSNLDTFKNENLELLRNQCRRFDDAKNHDYYTVDEANKLRQAKELAQNKVQDKQALQEMIAGVRIKTRHDRYPKVIAELNDATNSIFDCLSKSAGADPYINLQLPRIKDQWQRRALFASLDSPSLLALLKNLEQIHFYVTNASEEIENDHSLNQDAWLSTVTCLQELAQLNAKAQADIVDAMLERLKLVPPKELARIDSYEEDRSYCDDIVYYTLNSLVTCGLSEDSVIKFAQQMQPTKNLTVNIIKQFRNHILNVGTDAQKTALEELTIGIKKSDKKPAKAKKLRFANDASDRSPSSMQDSGWLDTSTGEILHISVEEIPTSENEIKSICENLPTFDLSTSLDSFNYVFYNQEEEFILNEAQALFDEKLNQRFFIDQVKKYLLQHPDAKVSDPACLDCAYNNTAMYLIQHDAKLFERSPLENATQNFMMLAHNQVLFFGEDQQNQKFEEAVLNPCYEAIRGIEARANEIFNELRVLSASSESLKLYRKTFIDAAYKFLGQEKIDQNKIEEAKIIGKKAVFILRYVRQIPQNQQALYQEIAERCISSSDNPNDIDNWEKSLDVAQKALNFINYLKQDRDRIKNESSIKTFFMDRKLTERKMIAYKNKIKQLKGLGNIADFNRFTKNIEKDLLIERSFFGFGGTSSTSELNLRRYFCGKQ